MSTILFELGTEELPPKSLKTLRDALASHVQTELEQAGIAFTAIKSYAAPRRLALQITGVAERQPDRVEQKRGPAVKAAFDREGKPTKAALGFAQGLGVDVSELITIQGDKGDYVGYQQTIHGQATRELLPAILQAALDALPIAKRMRSGTDKNEFVRPVQWVVLMQDDAVIDATIQGKQTGNQTRGHRFHAPDFFVIEHADRYAEQLQAHAVIADFDARQVQIIEQVQRLAQEVGAQPVMPQALLDEVTALVDLPVALRARFEPRFLAVPQEALISTMQADQKYFCLVDDAGKLQPYFVFISNLASRDPAQIIAGNEKVVRPRLADAEFFFLQDQKQPLFALTESLKTRVFQDQLGTLWDKAERIAKLAALIAAQLGANVEHAARAGLLAKADLASTLVGEFPELQGVAGTYYAHLNQEPSDVADAIEEQYLPKFSGDQLPVTPIGTALALADRLDTLVGIFGIGEAPTGSKDPFSLRRAAIGVLRILIEKQLPLNLVLLIEQALLGYGNRLPNLAQTFSEVMAFFQARYRAMYEEQGVAVDTILAVQALSPAVPLDFDRRIKAVQAFRALPAAVGLAEANKRVANILVKALPTDGDGSLELGAVHADLLQVPAERALYDAVQQAQADIASHSEQLDYTPILQRLAQLEQPLAQFFADVMVNVEDESLRHNRLALLKQVRDLFLQVADISQLQ
ncbi:glycine--tRNA ligase subunit beta [Moraxella atlantae]|uniref:glycine--tRNA ligase subunit beta n=1 Tax=Faucicola atlantae TaxID=34059 RepID=UPI003751F2FF